MAKGWESKSVEEQQQLAETPVSKEQIEQNKEREKAENARKVQALKLNIARIREQLDRTSNERYQQMLNNELEHLQAELSSLQ
ncbi:MAG TPA: hypothetical protein VMT82_06210 [candidate division Zixibacteria bacterium]|nr:hypothetical protein [candidate division Zixibacteria bacterium]